MGSAAPLRTLPQNRRMWSLIGELARASGLDEDELKESVVRPLCMKVSGQVSTARLSQYQADQVIAGLEKQLAEYRPPAAACLPGAPAPQEARHAGRVTPAQQKHVAGLFAQIGYAMPEARRKFCERQIGKPWPQTMADADAIIGGLKPQVLRSVKPREIWARFQALDGHPALDAFERGFVKDVLRRFTEAEAGRHLDKVVTTGRLLKLIEAEDRCGVSS